MKWEKPKLFLSMNIPIKHKTIPISKWNRLRSETLLKSKNICDYCGGRYDRLICTIYRYPKASSCCGMCFNIQHLTIKYCYQFNLLKTDLTQVKIVRQFVDFYEKNNRCPTILEIDKNALAVPLSIVEYLMSPFKTDLKLFPNEYFNIDYLDDKCIDIIKEDNDDENILSDSDKLLEDIDYKDTYDYYNSLQKNDPCFNIKTTTLDKHVIKHLNHIFYPIRYSFIDIIKESIKKTRDIDFDIQKTDMDYFILQKNIVH